ncbi:MAG TPA: molybdate ABC transporter substrate-binding protein, partial [Campylobacteraceae bacterium]|nr:molybdate ABC transporter substrate-binding protein [Campylobacteraceae bacterium]
LYAQSVAQVLSYILTAVDVGFVAKSSLYSPKMRAFKEGLHWITVDPAYYSPIEQGMVMLKRAKGNPDAEAFYRFIFSDEVKKILKAYGYKVP